MYVALAVPAVIWLPGALVNESLNETPVTDALTPAEAAAAITAARQAVLLSVGGLLAVFTLFLTQRRDRLARARHEIDRQKHEIDRDANRTTRYTEAIKQLGDGDHRAIRLGGIYALERLAADSPRDRQTILDVLSSWIREASPLKESTRAELRPLPMDVAAAAIVIGRISKMSAPQAPVQLGGAYLVRTDFTDAIFVEADLNQAELFGTDFDGANLARAQLVEANLALAHLADVNLTEARLPGANLNLATLTGATVTGADFSNATLDGANLRGVQGLTSAQVESARGWDGDTRWPKDFTPPTPERRAQPVRPAFPPGVQSVDD